MADSSIERSESSRVAWDQLEEDFRQRIQGYLQDLLEEEMEELLGRQR